MGTPADVPQWERDAIEAETARQERLDQERLRVIRTAKVTAVQLEMDGQIIDIRPSHTFGYVPLLGLLDRAIALTRAVE